MDYPDCLAVERRENFTILAQARHKAHLDVLEALYIKKLSPGLCLQKEFIQALFQSSVSGFEVRVFGWRLFLYVSVSDYIAHERFVFSFVLFKSVLCLVLGCHPAQSLDKCWTKSFETVQQSLSKSEVCQSSCFCLLCITLPPPLS